MRVLVMEKKPGGDFGLVPIEQYTALEENELFELYRKSIRGDGQCAWGHLSMFLLGSEQYWKHIRLMVISWYAQIENLLLEMHDSSVTYGRFKIADLDGYDLPFSYTFNVFAGHDPDQHASMYELVCTSRLRKMNLVCLLDYERQVLPGGSQAILQHRW